MQHKGDLGHLQLVVIHVIYTIPLLMGGGGGGGWLPYIISIKRKHEM